MHVVRLKFPPGEIARAGLVLMGLGIGAYLVWRIQEVLLLMLLAILLATSIEPLVDVLRRGPFNRGTGVLAVYTVIIAIIGLAAYAIVPNVASQAASFTENLPNALERLRPVAAELRPSILSTMALEAIASGQQAVQAPKQPAEEQIVQAGATAAHTIFSFLTVFVLAYYWLVERASIKRVVLRSVPVRYAHSVNVVWLEVEEKLGGWVRGQLILMLTIGVLAAIGYSVAGLPNPVLLGVIAGLFEIVPMIGPWLAFTPAFLVALSIEPQRAVIVAVYALIIQQLESNVLVPRLMGRTVGVSPLTVFLGILVGAALYGLPGAFLAVPLAGALQVILAHTLRTEDPGQSEEHRRPEERVEHEGGGMPPQRARAA